MYLKRIVKRQYYTLIIDLPKLYCMYQNNVHISLILIIVIIILLFLTSIQYSIGLAQTNDNPDLASLIDKGNTLYYLGKYQEAIQYYESFSYRA